MASLTNIPMTISSGDMAKQDFGDMIRSAFKRSGLTMLAVSRRSGVPYSLIHGLLAGTKNSRLTTAAKVCEVLGLELRPRKSSRKV